MSLDKMLSQLSEYQTDDNTDAAPVELWDPPFCGDIDLQIRSDGSWYYNGSVFKREAMVKLFASVLKKEQNNYFLVTPVEKVGISVDDVPFIITQWQWLDKKNTIMQVSTNLQNKFILNADHPITLADNGFLYVNVRRNLLARIHRNVYYQWLEFAEIKQMATTTEVFIYSADKKFILGKY